MFESYHPYHLKLIPPLLQFLNLFPFLPRLTSTTDGFYVVWLKWFMEDHHTSQLALQGGGAPPLAVLGPCRDHLCHRLGFAPQQSSPSLWGQDATKRGASRGGGG